MTFPCSGVILAGGENKRFSGKNKAFCRINGQRIIDHVHAVFRQVFDEIIIVTNSPSKYMEWDAFIVRDVFTARSSLTGIHAGLFYSSNPYAFFSACDTPFLKKELVECVVSQIDAKSHAVIPETEKGIEPLCAAYARECLPVMEKSLAAGHFKIRRIFSKNRLKKIPEARIRKADKDLVSFFNVNSPEELEIATQMAKTGNIKQGGPWTRQP